MNAAKMSAVPPDPAKISQGAEFSSPLQILCSLKQDVFRIHKWKENVIQKKDF